MNLSASPLGVRVRSQTAMGELIDVIAELRDVNDGWLFVAGYGSLPTKPEAGMELTGLALLEGYEKSMSIRVRKCRGTVDQPGLVAGIEPRKGQDAMAAVLKVDPDQEAMTLTRLWRRELLDLPYQPKAVTARMADGQAIRVLAFVARPGHEDVVAMTPRCAAAMIRAGAGKCGTNTAYLHALLQFEQTSFGRVTENIRAIGKHLCPANPLARA